MIIEAGVSTCATEGAAVPLPSSVRIAKLLCQAEVNSIKYISLLANSHEEIIWLNIAMEKAFGMDVLDSRDGLVGDKEDSLERETSVAIVQQILEGWAKKIVDQRIVVALLPKPQDSRYSNTPRHSFICLRFGLEDARALLDMHELYRNLLVRLDVGP